MAKKDQKTDVQWASSIFRTDVTGANDGCYDSMLASGLCINNGYGINQIGSGISNADAILTRLGLGNAPAAFAARFCGDGGHTDWYLPSMWELSTAYNNSSGNFSGGYWSSIESKENTEFGWYMSGGLAYYGSKNLNANVRAVRTVNY